MGVSRSAAELNAKLNTVAKVVGEQGTRNSIQPVAQRVQSVLEAAAAQAGLHKGSRIAGKPWGGVYIRPANSRDLGVGYARGANLVNTRTRAHVIGPRRLGTRTAIRKRVQGASLVAALSGRNIAATFALRSTGKGARALHWGNTFASFVRSRGTAGKHFYERAKPLARDAGAEEYGRTVHRALARVMG